MITQARLKELLHYNPDTGVFTRLISTNRNNKVGDIAGSYYKHHGGKTYGRVCVQRKHYSIHRLIWLYVHGEFPSHEIDHIDGDGSNNKITNLRHVTHQQNHMNQRRPKSNKTGVAGVVWSKRDNVWKARIDKNGKIFHLGSFLDKFEAFCARKSEERKLGFHKNHGANRPL